MSDNQIHNNCQGKAKNINVLGHKEFESKNLIKNHSNSRFIPTQPNYFQIRSQKPWVKQYVPKKDEPGIENQVRALSDKVKLISEKLETLTSDKKFVMLGNKRKKKNAKDKQVWVKKEDNLCLVAHTILKVLDTCLSCWIVNALNI